MATLRLYQSQVYVNFNCELNYKDGILNRNWVFCSNISTEHMLYTEADLQKSMDRIETINFHEERDVGGVRFWAYNAGHVLGAAMFMIEITGVKVIIQFLSIIIISPKS